MTFASGNDAVVTVTTTVGFGGAGGGAAVPAGLTVSVIPRCVVSFEPLQFGVSGNAIWMKKKKVPACVGVPDSVPLDDIERPGGEPPPTIDHTSSPGEQPCPSGSLNVIE